jgi:hypothetical protein
MDQLEMWETAPQDVSIEDMDNAVKALRTTKEKYDEQKAAASELYARYEEAKENMIAILKRAGKEEYTVKGYGKVSVRDELSVTTPKTPEQKQAFFEWIRETKGDDAYYAYMTVNSNSLNSMYRQAVEEAGAKGEVLDIPGLAQPNSYTKLSLRKA